MTLVYACRDIHVGEELCTIYGPSEWMDTLSRRQFLYDRFHLVAGHLQNQSIIVDMHYVSPLGMLIWHNRIYNVNTLPYVIQRVWIVQMH
jgi:hypothetical protein